MERQIIHSDLNNFFASVELLHRPALRNKPVIVGGDESLRHGIVVAKNDIAKKFGIKTAEPVCQARQKCPGLVSIPANYDLYVRFARMAREIYAEYTDLTESFGIDESWLDVTASASLFGDGVKIANEIRSRMIKEIGLSVSVGVSWNKVFAKLGSDRIKPNGLTVYTRDNYKSTLWPLPASELLYVGAATMSRLSGRGIYTIGDLANLDRTYLRRFLGVHGENLWSFANGFDTSPVTAEAEESFMKSIGHSTTCPKDLTNNEEVKLTLYVLAERVAARMREHGVEANVIQVYVRDNTLESFERQMKLIRQTSLAAEMVPTAMRLLERHYNWKRPIRAVGIRGSELVPSGGCYQLSMMTDELKRAKLEKLEQTTDMLRNRYGHFSVQRAAMLSNRKLSDLDIKENNMYKVYPMGFQVGS